MPTLARRAPNRSDCLIVEEIITFWWNIPSYQSFANLSVAETAQVCHCQAQARINPIILTAIIMAKLSTIAVNPSSFSLELKILKNSRQRQPTTREWGLDKFYKITPKPGYKGLWKWPKIAKKRCKLYSRTE